MGPQLIKKGLRRCWKCKKVLPLISEYFYHDNNNSAGFRKTCKKCASEIQGTEKCKRLRREYAKRYYKRHKSEIMEYRKKHQEQYRKYSKKYQENNPEKMKQIKENERQKTKKRRLKLRFQIFQRDNFTCQYCGRKAPEVILEIDHKYPKSKGGLDQIKNYITSCKECNLGKGDCILKEFFL